MTLKQANELCILAHKGQWRKPTTVVTAGWGCYKTGENFVHPNGNRIIWCNGDTFLVYEPYHTHPIAVAAMMNTEYRKVLALLHDVIEDTDYVLTDSWWKNICAPDMEVIEIPDELYIDLELLTKDPSLTYEQNIRRIKDSGRADAIAVKLADNCHNLSTGTEKQQQKYLGISLPILLGE